MRTVHRAGTITTACLCTVIALAPLPFVSTYLKAIAVWVLSATAALAISPYFSAGSQLACFVVDGLRVPDRPKPQPISYP